MIVSVDLDIDFDLLRRQKELLLQLRVTDTPDYSAEWGTDAIEGVISLIDGIQDKAAEIVGEKVVFG